MTLATDWHGNIGVTNGQVCAKPHPVEQGAYAPGSVLWFEYHCWEDPRSNDANAWYRSHQLVTVLHLEVNDSAGMTPAERRVAAMPFTYEVQFADGLRWCIFEDELSTTRETWYRPDPPPLPAGR